jgi:hypothetical protein
LLLLPGPKFGSPNATGAADAAPSVTASNTSANLRFTLPTSFLALLGQNRVLVGPWEAAVGSTTYRNHNACRRGVVLTSRTKMMRHYRLFAGFSSLQPFQARLRRERNGRVAEPLGCRCRKRPKRAQLLAGWRVPASPPVVRRKPAWLLGLRRLTHPSVELANGGPTSAPAGRAAPATSRQGPSPFPHSATGRPVRRGNLVHLVRRAERPVREADRRQVEDGAEMEREPGPARMGGPSR